RRWSAYVPPPPLLAASPHYRRRDAGRELARGSGVASDFQLSASELRRRRRGRARAFAPLGLPEADTSFGYLAGARRLFVGACDCTPCSRPHARASPHTRAAARRTS